MESGAPCTLWLWDGMQEYEGVVAKLDDEGFTAHLRPARRAAGRTSAGRRLNSTFFDLQRQFVGRRFLAYCKLAPDMDLQEVEVLSVQRSSSLEYDFFVGGVLHAVDQEQKEELRKTWAHGRLEHS